jgi:hypothetical protein
MTKNEIRMRCPLGISMLCAMTAVVVGDKPAPLSSQSDVQRRPPFILVLPAYRRCDRLIAAWNDRLGRDEDLVTCIPAPQDLKDPVHIEATFRQIKKGSPGWVTPSAEMVLTGQAVKPPSAQWLWYDPEPWEHTPQKEKDDPVAAAKALREYCNRQGLKFGMTPIYTPLQRNFDLQLAAKVATYCHAYILQLQDFQRDSVQRDRMAKFLREIAGAIHQANPSCLVGCQLGTAERYGGLQAALALYEATKDVAQIYTAWWEPEESEVIALLEALSKARSGSQTPAAGQPIKTLWWIAAEALTKKNAAVVTAAVKEWLTTGAFDAVSVGLLPPTFVDFQESISLVNQLNKAADGRLIAGMFPAGKDGWETSFNERFAERLAPLGVQFDKTRAVAREEWLARTRQIEAPMWAYVLEQPTRRPTAEEVESSIKAFVQRAREENKQVVLWLSGMMFRNPTDIDLVRRVWRQVGDQVDYVVWMDLPGVSQEPGRSLEALLDVALSLTPKEKMVIQWNHHPRLVTKDPEGTLKYIATCQAKGLHRFVVLANPALLQDEPWATFYRGLRRKH